MVSVDRDRLVDTASRLVNVPSFTGDEENAARLMVELFEGLDLRELGYECEKWVHGERAMHLLISRQD